jgi:hypothetical protein
LFSDLTPEAFLDALSKGKGRTVFALQSSDPTLYRDALLQGCVENLQYDRQCEENRAEYFMRLLGLARLKEQARETILKALPGSEDGWDRDWMIDMLGALTAGSDPVARQALTDLAQQRDRRAQDLLAETDEEGLQWVEQNVLPNLSPGDRWRIGMWLPIDEADDQTPTQRRLRAIDNEETKVQRAKYQSRPQPKPTANGFLRSLQNKDLPYVSPRDFAQLATVRERRRAVRLLLRETDLRVLQRLARSFRGGGFPLLAKRLFRHATHPDRGWAVKEILGTLRTPAVRRFALGLLRRRPLPWNAIEALRGSLRPGDEPIILRALQSTEHASNGERHDPILDVVHFLREHPEGRWQPHAEWIYEHSPCSMCRASAVDWMVEHGIVPEYIREEAPYDAEPDIREAVSS